MDPSIWPAPPSRASSSVHSFPPVTNRYPKGSPILRKGQQYQEHSVVLEMMLEGILSTEQSLVASRLLDASFLLPVVLLRPNEWHDMLAKAFTPVDAYKTPAPSCHPVCPFVRCSKKDMRGKREEWRC